MNGAQPSDEPTVDPAAEDAASLGWAMAELQREILHRDEHIERLQSVLMRKEEERDTLFSGYEETRQQLGVLREMLASKLGIQVDAPDGADTVATNEEPAPTEDVPDEAVTSVTPMGGLMGEAMRRSLAEVDGALSAWAAERVGQLQQGLVGVSGAAQERLVEVQQRLAEVGGKATELHQKLAGVGGKATELRTQALTHLPQLGGLVQDSSAMTSSGDAAGGRAALSK